MHEVIVTALLFSIVAAIFILLALDLMRREQKRRLQNLAMRTRRSVVWNAQEAA